MEKDTNTIKMQKLLLKKGENAILTGQLNNAVHLNIYIFVVASGDIGGGGDKEIPVKIRSNSHYRYTPRKKRPVGMLSILCRQNVFGQKKDCLALSFTIF